MLEIAKWVFPAGLRKPQQLSLQMLLVDTERELETRCCQDVHALKKFCALLELYFGRTSFFLKSSASLPHFNALERVSPSKKIQF